MRKIINKKFNINILNKDSDIKVLSRGETKNDIKIPDRCNRGEIIISIGTKGWLEWDGLRFLFEFDKPFKYPNWNGSEYRIDYFRKMERIKEQIKCYEASNEERIEYLVKNINIKRIVRGLQDINPGNIRFCLNMALENNLDLDMAIQTYLDDIEIQAEALY